MSSSVAARRSGSSRTSSLTAPSVISVGSISGSAPTHSRAAIEWSDVPACSIGGHEGSVSVWTSLNYGRAMEAMVQQCGVHKSTALKLALILVLRRDRPGLRHNSAHASAGYRLGARDTLV